MKITEFNISGPKLIHLDLYKDHRGFFTERFSKKTFKDLKIPYEFVQDNMSFSIPKTLRGLHYQINPNQGKLVGVISGSIFDVIVDLRKNSSTFGKHLTFELHAEEGTLLWVPGGFAHGFCVLGTQPAYVTYKVDCLYSSKDEGGILWNDHSLNISWPVSSPIVSEKDMKLPTLNEFKIKTEAL